MARRPRTLRIEPRSGRGPGLSPERSFLLELPDFEGDPAAEQAAALARLRALCDPSERPLVAWAGPEFARGAAAFAAERRALARPELPDLGRWLRVRLNLPFGPRELLAAWGTPLAALHPCRPAEAGARAHEAAPDPARMPGEVVWQPNLGAPPGGLGVALVEGWPHQAGVGVRVGFAAAGYQRGHPDLRHVPVEELSEPDPDQAGLGTWIMGVLFARPLQEGLTGICPRAGAVFRQPLSAREGEGPVVSWADAVDALAAELAAGDVLLLAAAPGGLPVEDDPAAFDAIRLAVARGVHVVESAGDADLDLDDPARGGRWDRARRDSGAILVTGYLRQPLPPPPAPSRIHGNRGSRVDAHAPSPIYTTRPAGEQRQLAQWFQGAASASAQVAGVVAFASAARKLATGEPVAPGSLRAALRASGTPARVESDRPSCGTQPDLPALLARLREG